MYIPHIATNRPRRVSIQMCCWARGTRAYSRSLTYRTILWSTRRITTEVIIYYKKINTAIKKKALCKTRKFFAKYKIKKVIIFIYFITIILKILQFLKILIFIKFVERLNYIEIEGVLTLSHLKKKKKQIFFARALRVWVG